MTSTSDALRSLPSVERLLSAATNDASEGLDHSFSVALAREVIDSARSTIRQGEAAPGIEALTLELRERVQAITRPPVRRVINATGVIIHTNLGRAPLSARALEAVLEAGRGYSNLEYELESGRRGSRHEHCSALLTRLTGAPASLVVNNNAAALLLVLAELSASREVVISRGELVEIGGGFRIPDVLEQSGARLVEVGTTNRTYAHDYAAAIRPETSALLRVHSSNFRVMGFTHRPRLDELVALARSRDIPVIEDLGSGSLIDSASFGVASEPTVQASLQAGVDLVCFSGDKLLGGPQAGVVVGRADLVQRLKRHPLMRALRPDKLTIAALAATLTEYLDESVTRSVPAWRMISTSVGDLNARAKAVLAACPQSPMSMDVVDGHSTIGGGALPEETLPTRLLRLRSHHCEAMELAQRLRQTDPPIVGRIEHGAVMLDLRTVDPAEDEEIVASIQRLGMA
ncbi:MAG TPA: L-seryl-tRNA(Sec) selenium transferase [Chloroflexota bacterium]|nr:L-seryl-tRNA(Sec) selenium transferase [Chloroflexota bacterium]